MKIQIADQISDIDEKTLYDWIKLGRVPRDASVWSETLTDGQWQPVSELPPVRKLWELDGDSESRDVSKSEGTQNELKVEQGFLKYKKRFPVVTLALIAVNVAIFHPLEIRLIASSQDLGPLVQFGAYSYHLIVGEGEYWRLLTSTFLHAPHLAPSPEYVHTILPWPFVGRSIRQKSISACLFWLQQLSAALRAGFCPRCLWGRGIGCRIRVNRRCYRSGYSLQRPPASKVRTDSWFTPAPICRNGPFSWFIRPSAFQL